MYAGSNSRRVSRVWYRTSYMRSGSDCGMRAVSGCELSVGSEQRGVAIGKIARNPKNRASGLGGGDFLGPYPGETTRYSSAPIRASFHSGSDTGPVIFHGIILVMADSRLAFPALPCGRQTERRVSISVTIQIRGGVKRAGADVLV